jgi:hypothetical protein
MCGDCAERHELLHAEVRSELRNDKSKEKEVTRCLLWGLKKASK